MTDLTSLIYSILALMVIIGGVSYVVSNAVTRKHTAQENDQLLHRLSLNNKEAGRKLYRTSIAMNTQPPLDWFSDDLINELKQNNQNLELDNAEATRRTYDKNP